MTSWTALRWINLQGPPLLARSDDGKLTRRPLWSLSAGAPYRDRRHLVDYAHPVRTLMVDEKTTKVFVEEDGKRFGSGDASPQMLRAPRLFNIHLIAGSQNRPYNPNEAYESVTVNFLVKQSKWSDTVTNPKLNPLFRTNPAIPAGPDKGFVQIVAEPQPDPEVGQKGDFLDQAGMGNDDIRMPNLRLVHGAVRLTVTAKSFQWLGGLEPVSSGEFDLILTADGIEIVTSVPFPGWAGSIKGGFLIAPRQADDNPVDNESALTLTLLPGHPETDVKTWLDAWQNALASKSATDASAPHGIAMHPRPSGLPPAFRWTLRFRKGSTADKPVLADIGMVVDAPPSDLRVQLLGSQGTDSTPNGVADLQITRLRLATPAEAKSVVDTLHKSGRLDEAIVPDGGDTVVIAEAIPPVRAKTVTKAKPDGFWSITEMPANDAASVRLKSNTGIVVIHDEHRLAAALRDAYGWEEPHAIGPREPASRFTESDRPLVSGFVPVERGWLQLPFPNLPPIDVAKDISLISAIDVQPSSAIDGFMRFGKLTAPEIISGHSDSNVSVVGSSAPWSATIEGAHSAVVLIAVSKKRISAARAALRNPQLSARGLFWLSYDRPDALEALPRLGAGAGSFFDIPLTASPATDLAMRVVTMRVLSFSFSFNNDGGRLGEAKFSLVFNSEAEAWKKSQAATEQGKIALLRARNFVLAASAQAPALSPWRPVQWLRHERLPLASTMPMTRAAASAVHPLESRELAPFARADDANPISDLGTITWASGKAFADVDPAAFQTLVSGWPTQPKNDKLPNRGIAFAAFGVPGVEVTPPLDDATAAAWSSMWFAVRYDLPALDEAFATVGLPKVEADKPPQPDGQNKIAVAPTATALDWLLIGDFWKDQERRRQLSLVIDSYLSPYLAQPSNLDVKNLIRETTWTVNVAFDANGTVALPYGALKLGNAEFFGNNALRGPSGQLTLNGKVLTFVPGADPDEAPPDKIGLIGWSPSTFDKDGWRIDNQGVGTADPVFVKDKQFIARQVSLSLGNDPRVLATATKAVDGAEVLDGFGFWFKDIPLNDGVFGSSSFPEKGDMVPPRPDTSTRFDSWLDPTEGFEWRLYGNDDAQLVFKGGRDRIPLNGIALEPLRLAYLKVDLKDGFPTQEAPARVEIIARLCLGDEDRRPEVGGNLVVLALTRTGNRLALGDIALFDNSLTFALDAIQPDGESRRVTVSGKPEIAAQSGTTILRLAIESLSLPVCGQQIELKTGLGWKWSGDGTVKIGWASSAKDTPLMGNGQLSLRGLTVTTGIRPDGGFTKTKLSLEYALAITPRGCMSAPITADYGAKQTLCVLGQTFKLSSFRETDGAVMLTATFEGDVGTSELAKVFKFDKPAGSFLLAAGVVAGATSPDGILELDSGRFEGEIRSTGETAAFARWVTCRLIRFEAEAGRRPRPNKKEDLGWTGLISVTGTFMSDSAICWPVLKLADNSSTHRCNVSYPSGSNLRTHNATLFFADHRLEFGVFVSSETGWSVGRTWSTFVTARHRLSTGSITELVWTSVEGVAIGPVNEIIPPLPTSSTEEPVTFTPRYRSPDGYGNTPPDADMIQPGLGRLRTAVDGALGRRFRSQLSAEVCSGTVVAGGFLGSIEIEPANDEGCLLRVPFLVGMSDEGIGAVLKPNALKQTDIPVDGIELAWADVMPSLSLRTRTAGGAASRSERDLSAALRNGALVTRDGEQPAGDILPAMLVEQSFGKGTTSGGTLGTTPFWLAAAAVISRCLTAPSSTIWRSLSVVVGSTERTEGKKTFRRGCAAVVWSMADDSGVASGASTLLGPALISGGGALYSRSTDFVSELWTGGDPDINDNSAINGYAASLALARHARPLFAAVRTVPKNGGGPQYFTVELPRPVSADLPKAATRSGVQPRFADNARGYAASPGNTAETLPWLSPVLEGRTAAVRDDPVNGSGIAGIGRSLALPAQAAAPIMSSEFTQLARSLVWMTEKRAPVYLPLAIKDLQAPPIGWLQTVPRRARLPADQDVAAVLSKTLVEQPLIREAQAFLPSEMAALTVGERAGIVTARRTFLLGAVAVPNGDSTFDQSHGRFGRPAQVGISTRRWIRTPRPSQLPENTEDSERNRRPEASPLLPTLPLRFVVGPADTIRGLATFVAQMTDRTAQIAVPWTATFVAAPLSDGVVTDRWDGSLRLRVELDLDVRKIFGPKDKIEDADENEVEELFTADQPTQAITPLIFLTKVLFPVDKDGKTAEASASLVIGPRLFQLRSLARTANNGEWRNVEGAEYVIRGVVDLVVDVAQPAEQLLNRARPIAPDLAAALSSGSQSSVDLRLTVHPNSWHEKSIFEGSKPSASVPLSIRTPADSALAVGAERPPVTLRWTLPAVMTDRGGLPLLPSTLLFVDPAYETGLASPSLDSQPVFIADIPNPPASRGRVRALLSVDRGRVNRRGAVAFMIDVRFEVPPPQFAPSDPHVDGDFYRDSDVALRLSLQLVPAARSEPTRRLLVAGMPAPQIRFASIYELSLAMLTETDGSPARLVAGDVLTLAVVNDADIRFSLWNTETDNKIANVLLPAAAPFRVDLTLTDEQVIEPPPALYAALTLTKKPSASPALALPLYAQSPLPWRMDFQNLKQDFRKGLVRRSATFVWGLTRSLSDLGNRSSTMPQPQLSAYVVKSDRNGQTYLPQTDNEFVPPERLHTSG